MSVFARFVAFEAIGWCATGVAAYAAVYYDLVPSWVAWGGFALFVAKDLVLFPLTRRAYEHGPTHGAAELIGSVVVVEQALEPDGYVRAGSERWRARLSPKSAPKSAQKSPQESAGAPDGARGVGAGQGGLEVGARARVIALEGVALVVEAVAQGE